MISWILVGRRLQIELNYNERLDLDKDLPPNKSQNGSKIELMFK